MLCAYHRDAQVNQSVAFGQTRITNANNIFNSARIRSDAKISRQLFTKFLLQGESKSMLPRHAERLSVGQNPLSNPEAWRVRATLKCGTREKGVQTPDVLPLSCLRRPRLWDRRVWKPLRNVKLAKREHVQEISHPKQWRFQMEKQ